MGFHLNALKISCPGGPKTSAIGNAQGICIGGLRRIAAVISGFRYNLEPTSTAGNPSNWCLLNTIVHGRARLCDRSPMLCLPSRKSS